MMTAESQQVRGSGGWWGRQTRELMQVVLHTPPLTMHTQPSPAAQHSPVLPRAWARMARAQVAPTMAQWLQAKGPSARPSCWKM